ncbi:MAG: hypothetical protein ABI171_01010 [Collimonas sp.]|uniref:hypothetical protein n=1 Tax=Collimonas sp. TaxID=1963772 RepID=UPI003264A8DB
MTEKKVDFNGANIGQAAAGDVVNEGSQFNNSNVINLHVNGQKDASKLSVEYLTNHQKRAIGKLIEKIVEATEEEPLDVWNQILARTGAKQVKLIPKEYFVELDAYLKDWLTKTTQPAQFSSTRPAAPRSHRTIPRSYFLVSVALGIAISVAAAALVVQNFSLEQRLQAATTRLTVCEFGGAYYSVGSVADIKGSPGATCTMVKDDLPPQWNVAKQKIDKKSSVARNPIRRKPASEVADPAPL